MLNYGALLECLKECFNDIPALFSRYQLDEFQYPWPTSFEVRLHFVPSVHVGEHTLSEYQHLHQLVQAKISKVILTSFILHDRKLRIAPQK